jgi:hypothetical protein
MPLLSGWPGAQGFDLSAHLRRYAALCRIFARCI